MSTAYEVTIKSGALEYNDSNIEVSLIVIGDKGSSNTFTIPYPKSEKGKSELTKKVSYKSNDVGKIQKIKIAHDSKKSWHLDSVFISKGDQNIEFKANRQIEGSKVFTELTETTVQNVLVNTVQNKNVKPQATTNTKYTLIIKTGDVQNAGTDANVIITIFGSNGKTEPISLDKKDKKDHFERGQTDEFEITAKDVGKINKINIGHDNKGLASAWFLDSVVVKKDKDSFSFNANRWLDEKSGDKKTNVDLNVSSSNEKERSKSPNKTKTQDTDDSVKYVVKVKTGSVRNAETDSSVFIIIHGNKIKTDKLALKDSKAPGKLFEKGKTDEFHIRAKNVGKVTKISIGHDSDGSIKSWYLESVVVSLNESNYRFVAKRWLDKEENDGSTWVDLLDEFENDLRKQNDGRESAQSEKKNSNPKNEKTEDEKNDKKLKDFRKSELDRLQSSLKRESSKIKFPKRKEHQPFVFNDLCPYYETKQLENLLTMPQNEVFINYSNRVTASGIVYPWIAHRMEHEVPISSFTSKKTSRSNRNTMSLNQLSQKSAPVNQLIRPNKSEIEGSTLTPRFPIVGLKKPKTMTGPFYVDDIEEIRKQLRKNFGTESNARQAEDKTRTVNDFYRMRLDHFHPLSKDHMVQVYHAYLDNTVGSKKALRELLNEEHLPQVNSENNRKSKSAVNV